jgi:hypothetical protein
VKAAAKPAPVAKPVVEPPAAKPAAIWPFPIAPRP